MRVSDPAKSFISEESLLEAVRRARTLSFRGTVTDVIGLTIEASGPRARLGELCRIFPRAQNPVLAEVVGFREGKVLLMPLNGMDGISPGALVEATGKELQVRVGRKMLGRVIDGLGRPIDGKPMWPVEAYYPAVAPPPKAMERERIKKPVSSGIRCIDAVLTCGEGQRVGIFSGSGVGKSTLMGMIARNTGADVSVIALVGERGREVKDFLEKDLGPKGLERSCVVVATSDQGALVRIRAAWVATAVAEYFREQGLSVVLMMDSVTRWCMAQREVGLAIGEPPTTRGYTPSVFANLPRLLERAGKTRKGSITGFYTVLVEGDDMDEPVADAVRGILDGHIVLSRDLAEQGHYPAIDVLASVSRLMPDIVPPEQMALAQRIRSILATYRKSEDLINIGAYVRGSNPKIDEALKYVDRINTFLKQGIYESYSMEEALSDLQAIFEAENVD